MLQYRARDAKPALRGLIRIGRRTDDDRVAERDAFQISRERAHNLFLDKNAAFERLPSVLAAIVRKLGVRQLAGVMRALDDVAVRVPGIAVATSEFAADVRIQGPVVHACRGGRIEDALGSKRDEPRAPESLIEHDGRTAGRPDGRQQRQLRNGLWPSGRLAGRPPGVSHNAPTHIEGTLHSRTAEQSAHRSQDTGDEAGEAEIREIYVQPYTRI